MKMMNGGMESNHFVWVLAALMGGVTQQGGGYGSRGILTLPEAAKGRVADDDIPAVGERAIFVRQQRTILVCKEEARGDGIHPDLRGHLPRELSRQEFGEIVHRTLRR